MKKDRFDLEEEIMNIWQTKDDLVAITERHYDDPDGPMTDDELSNVLIGLSELHETRCRRLWTVFDNMVQENGFAPLDVPSDDQENVKRILQDDFLKYNDQ